MADTQVAFIGGGNMARAIIAGMLENGWQAPDIAVAEPNEAARRRLGELGPLTVGTDNHQAASAADVVVFAVKPQVLRQVAVDLGPAIAADRLVISIAAGVTREQIVEWCGRDLPVVRVMPNTPAMVGEGASALFAGTGVSKAHRAVAESILGAVGITAWVPSEDMMDAVTALSGSGPAYFFYLMELMQSTARELGLDGELAREFALQTGLGAAMLARKSGEDFAELRRQVTSPGGTTHAAITTMQDKGLAEAVAAGLTAARDRSIELSRGGA